MALVSYGNVIGVIDTVTSLLLVDIAEPQPTANLRSVTLDTPHVGSTSLTDYAFSANSRMPEVNITVTATDPTTDGAIMRNQQPTVPRKTEYWA